MRQLNSLYILFTLILLLLTPNIAAASFTSEAAEIPYQINNSDRIIIGTVTGINPYYNYSIITIKVEEWLYNPLPTEVIKVRTEVGTNVLAETEADFTLKESVLLMLKDENLDEQLDEQLFRVAIGDPGKHPVSDREEVIEELKVQGKWQEENQIVDETNDTGMAGNTERASEKEENSNSNPESNITPVISPVWIFVAVLGAVMCARRK